MSIHLYLLAERQLEVLLCDDCNVLWKQVGDGSAEGIEVRVMPPDSEQRMMATAMVSPEGAEHMCHGHRHALCVHLAETVL